MNERKYTQKETDRLLDANNRDYVLRVKDMPLEDQPREKLIRQGPALLSQAELLAVILNSGSREENIMKLSQRIVKEYGERSIFAEKNAKKLSKDLEIPLVKSCQIVACGELGRRVYEKNAAGFIMIRNATDVYSYLKDMHTLPKEHLRGLYLNSHNRIIHDEVISIGTLTTSLIHAREVFRPAIEYSAAAIVLAHNHPSGVALPSDEDISITEDLVKAGKIIGIHILDHIIITKNGFGSIKLRY